MDWSQLYPLYFKKPNSSEEPSSEAPKRVEFADVGCGYGGLLGKKKIVLFVSFTAILLGMKVVEFSYN